MALNTRVRLTTSFDTTQNYGVLRTETALRSPEAATADLSCFTRNAKVAETGMPGSIRIPAGYFWQRLASGLCRVLPIVKVTQAIVTTSAVITVHCSAIFKVGEVLQNQANNAVVGTILSIDPDLNTITLAANAAVALPAGSYLHVAGTTIAKPATVGAVGVLGFNASILDLDEFDDVAMIIAASVYGARMPQSIAALNALFPMIVHS